MKRDLVARSNSTYNNTVVKFDAASVARMASLGASDARDEFKKLTRRLELIDIKTNKMLKQHR
jgi:hypothetical protein